MSRIKAREVPDPFSLQSFVSYVIYTSCNLEMIQLTKLFQCANLLGTFAMLTLSEQTVVVVITKVKTRCEAFSAKLTSFTTLRVPQEGSVTCCHY